MHALPSLPKHPLVVSLLALLAALLVLAVAAPELRTLDVSLGGGTMAETSDRAPAVSAPAGTPTWVADPLAQPLDRLAARP